MVTKLVNSFTSTVITRNVNDVAGYAIDYISALDLGNFSYEMWDGSVIQGRISADKSYWPYTSLVLKGHLLENFH